MNVGMNLCILWNKPTEDFSLAMYSVFEALEAFIPKPQKLMKLSLNTKMFNSWSRCSASALATPQTRCRQTWNCQRILCLYICIPFQVIWLGEGAVNGQLQGINWKVKGEKAFPLNCQRREELLTSYELIWQELPWKLQYLWSGFHPQGPACCWKSDYWTFKRKAGVLGEKSNHNHIDRKYLALSPSSPPIPMILLLNVQNFGHGKCL